MKYIITENQKKFLRRIGTVEQDIDSFMDHTYEFLQGTDKVTRLYDKNVESFIDLVGMGLSSMIMRDSNLEGDERIIVRNRIQRYITTEYRDRIKDYYLQRNKSYDNLNENEYYIRRRLKLIDELIDKNIDEVEEEGTLFEDDYDFANNIINWVVQDMKVPNDIDEYEIINFIKDEFGDYILSRFDSEDEEDDWDDEDDDDDNED